MWAGLPRCRALSRGFCVSDTTGREKFLLLGTKQNKMEGEAQHKASKAKKYNKLSESGTLVCSLVKENALISSFLSLGDKLKFLFDMFSHL